MAHKTIHPAFVKPEILKEVYSMYLNSLDTQQITSRVNRELSCELSESDVDEIIDYMNEQYV